MTDTKPGADELRIRSILRQRGVGPDAMPPPPPLPPVPAVPPKPTTRPRDWLDDILDEAPAEAPTEAVKPEEQVKRPWWKAKPASEPADENPAEPQAEQDADGEEDQEDDGEAPEQPDQPAKQQAKATGKQKGRKQRPAPAAARAAWDASPPDPRQSLVEAFDRIPYRLKWLAYHATAAAAGWRLGWVQWSTNTAAWYADGHWTTPSAWVLYGLGLCAYALYRRTRGWAWPIAWATAIPVSSVVVGVLLYAPNS